MDDHNPVRKFRVYRNSLIALSILSLVVASVNIGSWYLTDHTQTLWSQASVYASVSLIIISVIFLVVWIVMEHTLLQAATETLSHVGAPRQSRQDQPTETSTEESENLEEPSMY